MLMAKRTRDRYEDALDNVRRAFVHIGIQPLRTKICDGRRGRRSSGIRRSGDRGLVDDVTPLDGGEDRYGVNQFSRRSPGVGAKDDDVGFFPGEMVPLQCSSNAA